MANGTQNLFNSDDYELIDPGVGDSADMGSEYEILEPGMDPGTQQQQQPQQQLAPGQWYDPVIEPMQAIGAGLAGTVVGGWRGLAELASGGSLEDYGNAVVETQNQFNEWGAPETQRGAEAMQTIGELMEKGVDLARIPLSALAGSATLIATLDPEKANAVVDAVAEEGLGNVMGDAVYEKTGSPLLAAAVSVGPELAGGAYGIKKAATPKPYVPPVKNTPIRAAGRAITDPVGSTQRRMETKRLRHEEMANAIRLGHGDERVVGYILDGRGKVVKDPELMALGNEAHRQGFDKGALAAIQGANPADKEVAKNMLAIKRQGDRDKVYKQTHRPGDELGKIMSGRIRYIRDKNREAGRQIDGVAKSLKGKFVDYRSTVDDFIAKLDGAGVGFDNSFNPIFGASDFVGSPAAQNLIRQVFSFMKNPGRGRFPDAYDLHRMKKVIDETVTYGKNAEGLAGKAEVMVKEFRAAVDDLLDTNFPEYNRVNTQYADTIRVLDSIQGLASSKLDLSGPYADAHLGKLMRRISTNYSTREPLMESMDDIERVFTKYGGEAKHNPVFLTMYANELDDVFGPAADAGFVAGIREGAKKGMAEYAAGRGAIHTMVDMGKAATEAARGINRDNAYDVMERFLNYGD